MSKFMLTDRQPPRKCAARIVVGSDHESKYAQVMTAFWNGKSLFLGLNREHALPELFYGNTRFAEIATTLPDDQMMTHVDVFGVAFEAFERVANEVVKAEADAASVYDCSADLEWVRLVNARQTQPFPLAVADLPAVQRRMLGCER